LGGAQRLAGYRRALAEAGIPFDDALVFPGAYGAASGRERAATLLDRVTSDDGGYPLPTALFCANDDIAAGSMEVFASRGVRVPDDISVAGFDDLLTARMTTPALTTVRQPFAQLSERAVELLLTQIGDGVLFTPGTIQQSDTTDEPGSPPLGDDTSASPAHGPHTEVFGVELVVRGSVGPPRVFD